MSAIGTISVQAEDIRSEDATALLDELTEELKALYESTDGKAGFELSDVEQPRTAFIVARIDGYAVGCGALRKMDDKTAEVKRMYTRPEYRRSGVAWAILSEADRLALEFGYDVIKLQTGYKQLGAAKLYERFGYFRIPHYSGKADFVLAFQKNVRELYEKGQLNSLEKAAL